MALLFKRLIFFFPIAVIISLVEASYNEVKRIEEEKKRDKCEDEMKGGNSYE